MSTNLKTSLKAEAISLALAKVTGRRPIIEKTPAGVRIYWSDEDLPAVRAWFESQVSRVSDVPPDITIDLLPVVSPYAVRNVAPAVLVTLAVGVLLGRLM